MGCATSTIKFLAFLFNILCCIFGALTLSASAYALVTFGDSDAIHVPCIVGITLGSLLFLTTFLGCCGALRECIRLTWIYAMILLLLMGAQIAANLLLSTDFDQLAKETVERAWDDALHEGSTMAAYEIKYECCGKTSSDDYVLSGQRIPDSCYRNQNSTQAGDLYAVGCVAQLQLAFAPGAQFEEISDWSLVGVEAVTLVLACFLAISLRNKKRRSRY